MTSLNKNSVKTLVIRRARPDDGEFVQTMLFEASYFRMDAERPARALGLSRPDLAALLGALAAGHALSLVAFDGRGTRLGAGWLRFERAAGDATPWLVGPEAPELGIGVREGFRGRGVGTALLMALLAAARERGFGRVCLCAEVEDVARKLYERFGFRAVRQDGPRTVLAVELDSAAPVPPPGGAERRSRE